MPDNNPGHAYRVQLISRTLANNATLESDVFPLYSYDLIGGTLYCDKEVTLTGYQGPTNTHPQQLDAGESVVHPGVSDVGNATRFRFESYSAEGYGQVKVRNVSGATATVRLAIELRMKG